MLPDDSPCVVWLLGGAMLSTALYFIATRWNHDDGGPD